MCGVSARLAGRPKSFLFWEVGPFGIRFVAVVVLPGQGLDSGAVLRPPACLLVMRTFVTGEAYVVGSVY